MSSFTRIQLEDYLKTIDVKANRVLDVGGSQNSIKGRTKSWDVKEYKILDLETPHECKQKPDIVGDLNKVALGRDYYINLYEYFDTAFCLEVSEYWWNPFIALDNIKWLLKKDGILYLSTHFLYPVHNPVVDDYLRYTPRGITKLLEETVKVR